MSELYQRVLLWHKLVCSVTGGLALCSAKRTLPRDEAREWSTRLRNVADEIDEVLARRPFILDDKGRRVSDAGTGTVPATKFFNRETAHEADLGQTDIGAHKCGEAARPSTVKVGGPRVARRKDATQT